MTHSAVIINLNKQLTHPISTRHCLGIYMLLIIIHAKDDDGRQAIKIHKFLLVFYNCTAFCWTPSTMKCILAYTCFNFNPKSYNIIISTTGYKKKTATFSFTWENISRKRKKIRNQKPLVANKHHRNDTLQLDNLSQNYIPSKQTNHMNHWNLATSWK